MALMYTKYPYENRFARFNDRHYTKFCKIKGQALKGFGMFSGQKVFSSLELLL